MTHRDRFMLLVLLSGCSGGGGDSGAVIDTDCAPAWPVDLRERSVERWELYGYAGGETWERRYTGEGELSGIATLVLSEHGSWAVDGASGTSTREIHLACDADGVSMVGSWERFDVLEGADAFYGRTELTGTVGYQPPRLLVPADLGPGGSWSWEGHVTETHNGQTILDTDFDIDILYGGKETVTLPTGEWDTVVVEVSTGSGPNTREHYALGFGPVGASGLGQQTLLEIVE